MNISDSHKAKKIKSDRLGLGPFELLDVDSFSRKKVRTSFICKLDGIKRDVVTALYKEAFYEFVLLAWSQFPQATPQLVSSHLKERGFLAELERVIKNFSASPYNAESKAIHSVFLELLYPIFGSRESDLLKNNPRGVLIRELFRPLRKNFDAVTRAFPDWATLQKIESAKPLCSILIKWSRDWNLNVEWCRDYAVVALCDWMTGEEPPQNELQLSFRGAVAKILVESLWAAPIEMSLIKKEIAPPDEREQNDVAAEKTPSLTREEARLGLFKDLDFSWKGLDFHYPRWNPLASYRDAWASESEERFKSYLAKRKENGDSVPTGVLTKFRAKRDEYLRKTELEADGVGLIRTPRRRADDNIKWLIHYQIPPCMKYREIARKFGKDEKTVREGIADTAALIGLTLRSSEPDKFPGRPKGSKTKSTGSGGRTTFKEKSIRANNAGK